MQVFAVLAGLTLLLNGVQAASISSVLSASQIQSYTGAGATYGPQSAVGFADGPFTVGTGVNIDIFAGPKPAAEGVSSLLFVLSALSGSSPNVNFDFTSPNFAAKLFGPADFYSTATLGFPALIGGIGNGEVNGIKFPDAIHGAVLVSGMDLTKAEGTDLGNIKIYTDTNLRVDIFGVSADGRIVNNTPNSHSIGISVPEPTSFAAAFLALGFGGLLISRNRK